MKKHFLLLNLFFFLAICITSCSSDDNFNEENTISSDKLLPVSILGDNGDKILYTYNDKNQITEIRQEEQHKDYIWLHLRMITYDEQGKPIQVKIAEEEPDTPLVDYIWYKYNFTYEGDSIVNIIDADTNILRYKYTINNNLLVKEDEISNGKINRTTEFKYDQNFNIISEVTSFAGKISSRYDFQYDYNQRSILRNVSTPEWLLSFVNENFAKNNQLISTLEEDYFETSTTQSPNYVQMDTYTWDSYIDSFPTYVKTERKINGNPFVSNSTITYTKAK
ncbi:hypothetical protein ETU10_00325 [Apibacter muscae]|uniref:hypothetical protein n=1 Tax=Apibacter muscae TaxID=2509004 RepID=UPI0011AD0D47|nr:hypothetical protein [Apibacter muscae]TWP25114.1 hypothetical protein ETU10_00325 [Apibacter muscae]